MREYLRYYFLVLAVLLVNNPASAQGNSQLSDLATFGNRIEWRPIRWMAFHSPALHVYYPQGADSLPAFIAAKMPGIQRLINRRMGGGPRSAPQLVVYPSLEARYQSSIGSREQVPLKLPTFVSRGSRMVLHFDGSYEALESQLYLATVRLAWDASLRNSSISSQISGGSDHRIPSWFGEGLQRWFASGWSLHQEEALRNRFSQDSLRSFYHMLRADPASGGTAFCYYLSQVFLSTAPRRVYDQLRSGKSLDRALRLVTKRRTDSLYAGCFEWFRQRSAQPDVGTVPDTFDANPELKVRIPGRKPGQVRIRKILPAPNGEQLALVMDLPRHLRAVYLMDATTGRAKRILKYSLPPWVSDHSSDQYPLLHWESGESLQVVLPRKGGLMLRRFTMSGEIGAGLSLPLIDGTSAVIPLGRESWLLSAWLQGQSDLLRYAVRGGRYQPLTNDPSAESDPAFPQAEGSGAVPDPIYFSAVRKGDTSFAQDSAAAYQGIYVRSATGIRPVITDTLSTTYFSQPVCIDASRLLLHAEFQGRSRIAVLELRNAEWRGAEAAASLSLIGDAEGNWQYLAGRRRIMRFSRRGDSLLIRSSSFDRLLALPRSADDTTAGPWLLDYRRAEALRRSEDSILRAARAAAGPSFLDGVFKAAQGSAAKAPADSTANAFHPKKAQPYIVQLYSAYFSTQVNNDYFINRFQPYGAFQGSFKVPEVGGIASAGLSDLFEHHHLSFAYRLPAGSEGSMFFAKYGNTARRLDWSLAYFRNVESIRPDPQRAWVDEQGRPYPNAAKVKTHYYELGLHYPLSYQTSVGGTVGARKDRTVFLAMNQYTLSFPSLSEFWLAAHPFIESRHLEPTLPGLYRGWYAKSRVDIFKTFTGSEAALAGFGMELQWHKPLYRYVTLVMRAQAGVSGGDRKLLYNLGGVANNLTPRIDSSVQFAQDAPYAYQTLITPLRGYLQNALYGSRYALLNADVYVPVFASLFPMETSFPSINELQLGLFSDLAAAGGDPRHTTAATGWLWSYGVSARTRLAGYPLRFDLAWPGALDRKPVWYLSLSL